MVVLNILLYRPLRKIMIERQEAIDGGHQKAQDLESSIKEKMDSYQDKLQQAKTEGVRDANDLRAEAGKEELEILSAARNSADKELAGIKSKVAQEVDAARTTLNKETKSLASLIASKVLGRDAK
jgi:F-type H+-transporting ATPase subunit b